MKPPEVSWEEGGGEHRARWRSESAQPPKRIVTADDRTRAGDAFRLAAEGTALLYRGDYHNARQLLSAMGKRVRAKPAKRSEDPREAFNFYRLSQGREAQVLGKLLIPLDVDYGIPLRRAPDVRAACTEAWGPAEEPSLVSLRELLGVIGAHEWRSKGVEVPALGGRIHPHYGVFAPIRGEYVELVAKAPLPQASVAWDIGTGTGVLALVLAKRGVPRIIATDADPRALACAADNAARFGLAGRIQIQRADLWPEGRAGLIVCNPPWIPARPTSSIERAVYDPDSAFLRRFLRELPAHLEPGGEAWLILSDLAEHLGLRPPEMLAQLFAEAGLVVRGTLQVRPGHARVSDESDILHSARAQEVTTLYRLGAKG